MDKVFFTWLLFPKVFTTVTVHLIAHSCQTLCDLMDCSSPGSSVHGDFQARILDCHALLQRIFPTQRLNLRLLHCRFFIVWATRKICATAKSLQLCPTLCDPRDGSPPGSPIPGILQARTLEWVAISFSNAWKWKVKVKSPSHVQLLVTPWTAAYQAPPSMEFPRQEYWSGVPLGRRNENHNHRKQTKLITWTTALSNSMKLWACHVRPPKMDGSWWRVVTKCSPLEKGMAKHFSILSFRTPWTVWKSKKIGHWKMNSPGQ